MACMFSMCQSKNKIEDEVLEGTGIEKHEIEEFNFGPNPDQ
ncbi:MAG: hypothetical protein S4CHLAM123_11320 [Chlamydiales bacterium]|nr:hypothetical protein [Chlamydiales bacterium]